MPETASHTREDDMSKTGDWYPFTRTGQIAMVQNWISIMSPAEVRTGWGIPAANR
jgi:hypothetical protein